MQISASIRIGFPASITKNSVLDYWRFIFGTVFAPNIESISIPYANPGVKSEMKLYSKKLKIL